jgi:serine/threonine protein kinase
LTTPIDELYGNRYRVTGLLGTGGMARVYRARDELLGREVALKVLSERLSSDRSFVERFRREAQNAAGLNHPNIVALYDYGDEDKRYFIVMELIEGRSLSEVLDEDGALMPERAAEIARDTANGLGRAHEAGIVHRDIKPHNIMITNNGQTKVTDFGIARALGGGAEATMTQTGMVIGTAAYLSPEQAQGNPVDARSDVYSLGCVLHESLTGDAPFSGDTPLSIAYKHVRETPERASAVNSDVPEALDAIVMKAMSKNPDNRYATANEMAEDLDRFLAG